MLLVTGDIPRLNARRYPGKTALVFEGRRTSFLELNRQVNRLANGLLSLGIKKGDKVAVIDGNSDRYVVIYLALAKTGALMVPLNFRYAPAEVSYVVQDCEAVAFIVGEDYVGLVNSVKAEFPRVRYYLLNGPDPPEGYESIDRIMEGAAEEEPPVELDEDDEFFIGYTSGTTGKPKGSVLTHRQRLYNSYGMIFEFDVDEDDVTLNVCPLFHALALHTTMQSFMIVGATNVIVRGFDAKAVYETIERERVTHMSGVPTMFTFLLNFPERDKYDVSSFKKCWYGGSIMPVEVLKQAIDYFEADFWQLYGLTEVGIVSVQKPKDQLRKAGVTGRELCHAEVRVVNEEGRDVRPDGKEVGEIIGRGKHLNMNGYYKAPQLDEEVMREGWFYTGDLAVMDEEGFFTIVDRKKDMIISGGENIYPREIEEVLYTHPGILEAAV
ncbi:MAG: AMP-binding protein, partial [Nitrospinota bacterium]